MFRKKNDQAKQLTEDWVISEDNGGSPVLKLSGELGFFTVPVLDVKLRKFLASYKNTSLEVDMSAVSGITDSRIISIFIQAYRRAQRRKIQLRLLKANSAVRHAFESVNASEMLFAE